MRNQFSLIEGVGRPPKRSPFPAGGCLSDLLPGPSFKAN